MPPDGMRGLCQMANGMCAGFAGNSLYLCEPLPSLRLAGEVPADH